MHECFGSILLGVNTNDLGLRPLDGVIATIILWLQANLWVLPSVDANFATKQYVKATTNSLKKLLLFL